jgi:uncharacterized alkaline shock family protein YloU
MRIDKAKDLHIELAVVVRFGTNLRELGLDIQRSVATAIAQSAACSPADVNVIVAGIELVEGKTPKKEKRSP